MLGNESIHAFLKKLENLLDQDFTTKGNTLQEKIASIQTELPSDLGDILIEIAREGSRLSATQESGDDNLADFIFRCGQAVERLAALRQNRATENLAASQPEGLSPEAIETADLDAIAGLIAARDRMMKVVANFTLKTLLILAGLLILGLALGIL